MERLIYFDRNSTAPYYPSVRGCLENGILEGWRNPSSVYLQAQFLHQKKTADLPLIRRQRLNGYEAVFHIVLLFQITLDAFLKAPSIQSFFEKNKEKIKQDYKKRMQKALTK